MGRATDEGDPTRELDRATRSTREELDSTLGALRGAMSETLRWRSWVDRNPWTAVLVAAVIGVRLGRGRWL
jgi:ElaB/YqjD/DUF883 family membrane-anchored ribosome-binding protein